jgi:CRISPR/Cas system CSM-associated protein Csm3 (group 7 of RAMP superfamily)
LLGSGEDENSDIDLLRDWEGKPFIPGTSLAGAVRDYLERVLAKQKLIETIFGQKPKEKDDSTQSLIHFYDAELIDDEPKIQIRDGLEIDNLTKTVKDKTKYDYEVLERENKFSFRIEMILRENNFSSQIEDVLYLLLTALKEKKIRIGAKTRRGFGKIKLSDLKLLILNMNNSEDRKRWIDFDWDFEGNPRLEELNHNLLEKKELPITSIKVKFSLPYSLIIKHYYPSEPEIEDMIHLHSAGKPVIPGTSWTGALRHAIENIAREIDKQKEVEELIKRLFGEVEEEKKKKRASRIYIDESIIENVKLTSYTRNKVDRFTGGVVETALFDEAPVFNQSNAMVELNIQITSAKDEEIGLILLGIRELWYGLQSVGGDAGIGRGILKGEQLFINNKQINLLENEDKHYLDAFVRYLGS